MYNAPWRICLSTQAGTEVQNAMAIDERFRIHLIHVGILICVG